MKCDAQIIHLFDDQYITGVFKFAKKIVPVHSKDEIGKKEILRVLPIASTYKNIILV